MKAKAVSVFLLAFMAAAGWGQATSPFAVSVQPIVSVPIGPTLDSTLGDIPFYTIGAGAGLRAEYTPPTAAVPVRGSGMDAEFLPLNGAD